VILVHQEKVALALFLTVLVAVVIGATILESAGKGMFARPYSPDSRDGDLVSFQGTVEDVRTTASGGHQLLRVSGVRIFVPSSSVREGWPRPGEKVSILGIVQTYRGDKEILVQSATDLQPLVPRDEK